MSVRKKRSSAADVLRQELGQPLVIPEQTNNNNAIKPTPDNKPMTPPANDDAQLKAAQQEIADLKSKLEAQAKESQKIEKDLKDTIKETKETIVKLAEQNKETAKPKTSNALVKSKGEGRDNRAITARPVETREETARRRANTDIGWLD
jgi:septal ring factor EnvC (AmiA/AmiB activator)